MYVKEEERPLLKHLNEHIVCPICTGYLIDATTLVECLHSFCRGCIVRRLSSGVRACPVCNVATLSPLLPDVKLQRLVYLTVPGLFRSELEKRRHFRLINPQCSNLTPLVGAPDLTFDDLVSLSLSEIGNDYPNDDSKQCESQKSNGDVFEDLNINNLETEEAKSKVRYLKCPAGVTVRHILRLLMLKRGWDDSDHTPVNNKIELLGENSDNNKTLQVLNPSWTLLDLACIFKWKRDAPMKLLYRIIGKEDVTSTRKSHPIYGILDGDSATQVIEDIQRPPTPPPSPKPNPCIKMPCSINQNQPQSLNNSDYNKDSDAKKPRCEVTPLVRSTDTETKNQEVIKDAKASKVDHHKRKRHRNKRVIAEITTTPREDMLKLKVRLTPCPARVTQSTNQTKEKSLNSRIDKREKPKPNVTQEQEITTKWQDNPGIDDDSDGETIEQIIDSIPDEVVQIAQDINNSMEKEPPTKEQISKAESENEEKPKDAEVLRQLGLVNTHEIDREKLEKQLQESKANRVRSLLAEKQMRDTLESIKIMTNSKVKESTSSVSSIKKKGPPPLTPLKTIKISKNETAIASFVPNREIPLDLSNGGVKDVLDLSSTPNLSKESSLTTSSTSLGKANANSKSLAKPKEDRKSQDLNLRTLSDAAVSLLGNSVEKKVDGISNVTNKVALKIPQPHQRLSAFGMKMKPNLGIRHIPNPQAIVASQFRNQRPGYLGTSHRQS